MIDFDNLGKYRENNRIEAKKALGGLPHSIWETYSAFANTLGGIILLGVVEREDKTLFSVPLPDPERLMREFWDIVNNQKRVSANILSAKDVYGQVVDGNRIVVINVPRAQRFDRPIYLENNLGNVYRRNGEGDYKCTREEVGAMQRDAAIKTQDMRVLDRMDIKVFDYESLKNYRMRMKTLRPGHAWEALGDAEFICELDAAKKSDDGIVHPTIAGLLMFGQEKEITKEFPNYFLDYQEQEESSTRWTDRITSSSGKWSGNLFDFYLRVYEKIARDIKVSSPPEGAKSTEDTSVHRALSEALANCLLNADYYGRQGLAVIKKKGVITFSNPGAFRIDVETAKGGGISDPRNSALTKMFSRIGIGAGSGSGLSHIYSTWEKQGWEAPVIEERFDPDRITLALSMEKLDENKLGADVCKELIIEYLTDHAAAGIAQIAQALRIKTPNARDYLTDLIMMDIVVMEGTGENSQYRLKA